MNPTTPPPELDVRPVPCREKHAQIFRQWDQLPVGEAFVLVNDHDPIPLYYQFAAQFPDAFDWGYEEEGPDVFKVRITRLAITTPAPPPGNRSGGGGCGHHRSGARGISDATSDALDLRGLEPPLPLVAVLENAERLTPGKKLRARTDRQPIHAFPELERRGFTHESEETDDGSWLTTICRA